jgi:hypothetical protein
MTKVCIGRLSDMPEPSDPGEMAERLGQTRQAGESYLILIRQMLRECPDATLGQIREVMARGFCDAASRAYPSVVDRIEFINFNMKLVEEAFEKALAEVRSR